MLPIRELIKCQSPQNNENKFMLFRINKPFLCSCYKTLIVLHFFLSDLSEKCDQTNCFKANLFFLLQNLTIVVDVVTYYLFLYFYQFAYLNKGLIGITSTHMVVCLPSLTVFNSDQFIAVLIFILFKHLLILQGLDIFADTLSPPHFGL